MAEQFKGSVHVEGVDALANAFGRVNRDLKRELQKRLKTIGRMVADEAKGIAEYRGLHGDEASDTHKGALIARIQPTVRGGSVFIRDSARTISTSYPAPGYNYPSRFEYQNGGAQSFMRQALQGRRDDVIREMENLTDWIATTWGE